MADRLLHIDSGASSGGDGSLASPYDAFTDLNWTTIAGYVSAGDQVYILLKTGSIFDEGKYMAIAASGAAEKPIIIEPYGTGDRPIIRSCITIPQSWTDEGGGIYTQTIAYWQPFLRVDDYVAPQATSTALEDGEVYFEDLGVGANPRYKIWWKPSGLPATHTMFRGDRSAFYTDAAPRSYISISSIEMQWGYRGIDLNPFNVAGYSNIILDDLVISHYREAIRSRGRYTYGNTDVIISDSVISNCCHGIALRSEGSSVETHTDCQIIRNTITDTGLTGHDDESWATWTDFDQEAIGVQNINSVLISGNEISGGSPYGSVIVWVNTAAEALGNVISKNKIHDVLGSGLIISGEGTDNMNQSIVHNLIYGCGAGASGSHGGIQLNRDQDTDSLVANNVLYGNDINIYLYSGPANYTIKNNVSLSPTTQHVRVDVVIGSNALANNCYFPEGAAKWKTSAAEQATLAAWQTATSQDVNSIAADPLMVDPANADFQLTVPSPCIRAGVDVSLTEDILGTSIPQRGTPDIGAYEFVRAVPTATPTRWQTMLRALKYKNTAAEPTTGARSFVTHLVTHLNHESSDITKTITVSE